MIASLLTAPWKLSLERVRVLLVLFSTASAATLLSSAGARSADLPTPEQVHQQTLRAIEDYARGRKRGIDPRLIDQLASNILIFTSNFCYPPEATECSNNFRNTSMFSDIVAQYLDDLVTALPTETQSLADRLAEGNLGSAGWPSTFKLEIGILTIPQRYQETKLYLKTATGSLPLADAATLVLMTAGDSTIEVDAPEERDAFNVAIEPGARVSFDGVAHDIAGNDRGDLLPPDDAFCYSEQPPTDPVEPLWMFNWGHATFSEDRAVQLENLAPFTQQPAIAIAAEIAPSFECGEDCQAGLGTLFAQAVAVWRSGCSRCDPNALTLMLFGESAWLDWRLWRRLAEARAGRVTNLDLGSAEPTETQRLKVSPAWFGQGMVVPYTDISKDDATRAQICALSEDAAGWVKPSQYYLCGRGRGQEDDLSPTISFKDGETSCGSIAVACGLTYGNIEVNGAEYAFLLNSGSPTKEYRIGSTQGLGPTIDLWPVILHEVGHWFGLPHSDVAGDQAASDIMAPYGTGSPCVSSQSLTMLNNASDIRWKFRATSGGSLLPPP